jgi:hypothetical protein
MSDFLISFLYAFLYLGIWTISLRAHQLKHSYIVSQCLHPLCMAGCIIAILSGIWQSSCEPYSMFLLFPTLSLMFCPSDLGPPMWTRLSFRLWPFPISRSFIIPILNLICHLTTLPIYVQWFLYISLSQFFVNWMLRVWLSVELYLFDSLYIYRYIYSP